MGIYEDAEFGSRSDRPWVIVNMVSTIDGKAVPPTPEHKLFASPSDWDAMLDLRAGADAIGQGAVTAMPLKPKQFSSAELTRRRELRGKSSPPLVAVFSNGYSIMPEAPVFSAPDILQPLIFMPSASVARWEEPLSGKAKIVPAGQDTLDLGLALKDLRARGVGLLTVEGGPHLNGSLFAAGLVDELFVTVSPQIFAGSAPLTIVEGGGLPAGHVIAKLIAAHSEGNDHFLRYSISYRD